MDPRQRETGGSGGRTASQAWAADTVVVDARSLACPCRSSNCALC